MIPCLIQQKAFIKEIFSIFQVVCKKCHDDDVIHQLAVTVLHKLSLACPPIIFSKWRYSQLKSVE